MLNSISVFFLSLIFLVPAKALELELLDRWSWESISQMEWLDDDELVVACGSMLQFYSISLTGTLQKSYSLELPGTPVDLECQGGDLLVALGSNGFARVSFRSDASPYVHHINSMSDAGSPLDMAMQIAASDENGWFLTKSDDYVALWNLDPTGQETFHGRSNGVGYFEGPVTMAVMDSTLVMGGSWYEGYYWGHGEPMAEDGLFDLNEIANGHLQYLAWDALCGRTLFLCAYLNNQFGMYRYDLSDPRYPVMQESSSTIMGYYPVNWGCEHYFFARLTEQAGIERFRIEETGFPVAVDTLFETIHDLEFQGEYALARGTGGRLLYLHTGGEEAPVVLDEDVPSRLPQSSLLGMNKIIRRMCGGFQVLSYHEDTQKVEEDEYVPLYCIRWLAADENRLFLVDEQQLYLLHSCDSLGLAEAMTTPFEGALELQILGENLLGVRTSNALVIYSISDETGFSHRGEIAVANSQDVFAGSSRDLFHFVSNSGVVHYQLVNGVPGSSELIWPVETSYYPSLLYSDGTLAFHSASGEPVVLLSHDEFGQITLLNSPAETLDEILEFRGATLICKNGGTYFLQVGESCLQEILPGESVEGIHMQNELLLVESSANTFTLYNYWADPCIVPHLSIDYFGRDVVLTWSPCALATAYRVEASDTAYGPWEELMQVALPEAHVPIEHAMDFFRIRIIF